MSFSRFRDNDNSRVVCARRREIVRAERTCFLFANVYPYGTHLLIRTFENLLEKPLPSTSAPPEQCRKNSVLGFPMRKSRTQLLEH